jgi:hypothetical protein
MATAGTGTYTAGGTTVYSNKQGCTSFMVHILSSSANPGLVNVEGLHDAADFITMRPGATLVFRRERKGITSVTIKGSGGNVDADWGIVAKI